MLSVAFDPPLWATTLRNLRRLTRMAATALVLAVGLNGLAAAPATADPHRPAATSRHLADLPLAPAAPDVRYAAAVAPGRSGTATPATGAFVPATSAAHREPGATPAGPATRVPSHRSAAEDAAPHAWAGPAVPPADPGRGAIARRGPPHA